MAKINFIEPDGNSVIVDATDTQSVMEAATTNLIRGIVGECGGSCSCATCHVYVDAAWYDKLPPPDEMELGMLEGAVEPGPLSRLSCQLKVSDALDGLVVSVPAGQA
jgi:2Fe-2S ferredoxin